MVKKILKSIEKKAKLVILSTSAVAVVVVLFLATFANMWNPLQDAQAISYKGVTRKFYLTNMDNPKMNETLTGLPADMYNIPEMTVKKGDAVLIHYYNLETETTDRHSFTIRNGPYARNIALDGGQNQTISFIANQTGIFKYTCVYHMPSMTGQLVVLPPTLDEFRTQQRGQQE